MGSSGTIWRGSSEFAEYEVSEERYNNRPARLLFSGDHDAVQSGLALDDNEDLLFDYNQRFLEVCVNLKPERVLLIGGGAMTLPRALLKADKDMLIDVVERDDLLVTVAQQFFGFVPSERLNLFNGDGRAYLDATSETYDLVLIDAFSHLSIPPTLSTVEAVRAMKRVLKPSGQVIVNIVSAYYGLAADTIRHQLATYKAVFTRVEVFAAEATDSGWAIQNLILIASDLPHPVAFRSAPLPPLSLDHDPPRYDL